jgi:hypothetical protein
MTRYAEVGKDVASTITELAQPVQDATISIVGTVSETVAGYIPEVPLPSQVPTVRELVEAGFDLWSHLFNAQRAYVTKVLDAISPITSKFEQSKKAKAVAAA